jgi:IS30 family transposase
MSSEFKIHRSAIEWRRGIVLQRLSQGWSQQEIANELQLHQSTISLDCQWLRETSRQNLQTQIEERIPQQYAECHMGYKTILKMAYQIANDPNSKKSEVLQSLGLISDVYGKLMDLSTDGKTLEQAISWIDKKKELLKQDQQVQEEDLSSSSEDLDGAEEELEEVEEDG